MGKKTGKQPYIPLYIGDWEQDTNTISLEAEGALLKLVLKLWKSKDKGVLNIDLEALTLLLKKSSDLTLKILQELHKNRVLNIEFLEQNNFKIESRRMTKEAHISKVRKETGSKGGKKSSSKRVPKPKQSPEYDNEYNSTKEIKKASNDVYFSDLPNSSNFEMICRDLKLTPDALKNYIPKFKEKCELLYVDFTAFCNHFKRWTSLQLSNSNPTAGVVLKTPFGK